MGDDTNFTTEITDSLKGIKLTKEGKEPQKEILFVTDDRKAEILDEIVRYNILQVLRRGIEDTITTESIDEETGDRIIRKRDVKRNVLSVVEIVKQSPDCCYEAKSTITYNGKTYTLIDKDTVKIDGKEYTVEFVEAEGRKIEVVNIGGEKIEVEREEITKNQVYHHLPILEKAGYVIKYGTVTTGKRTTDYYRRTAKGFMLTKGAWGTEEKRIREKIEGYTFKMLEAFNLRLSKEQREELLELSVKRAKMQHEWRTKIAEMVSLDVANKEILSMYEMLLDYYSVGSKEYMDIIYRIREILFPEK